MHFKICEESVFPNLCSLGHNYTIALRKVLNICGNGFTLHFFFGDQHIKSPKTILSNRAFCNDENVLEQVLSNKIGVSHM